MDKVTQIIQRNTEIVTHIKEHLEIVNKDFLSKHLRIVEGTVWNRQDPPVAFPYKKISFDDYAARLLHLHWLTNNNRGPFIINTELHDSYITSLHFNEDLESLEECKEMAINSFNRNDYIRSLVGKHCLWNVWHSDLTTGEQAQAQEVLIVDLKTILNFDIDSLRCFDIKIGDGICSCEIEEFGSVKLTKFKGVFGDKVNYYDNKSCLTKDRVIDIPFSIYWMSHNWDVIDISEGFFNNCNEVESVSLPDELRTFNWSFWNCPNLKEIKIKVRDVHKHKDIAYFSHEGVLYRTVGDGECELVAYPNMHAKDFSFPSKIGYRRVIGITKFAFKDCHNIESIHIPKFVKYIGCNAFYRCINLKYVYYYGLLEDINIEGFYGNYGSVNPIWLCKTTIPSWEPKVNISFSEQDNVGILSISIGNVDYNLRSFKSKISGNYIHFYGETAVTSAFWKMVMHEYPNEQHPIVFSVDYIEALEFVRKLNTLTQLEFDLPSREYWLDLRRRCSDFKLYLKCDNLPLNEWKSK